MHCVVLAAFSTKLIEFGTAQRASRRCHCVPFPWEKLTDKPLIYVSMGTLVNGLDNLYRTILDAVGEFSEMQMVLSVGRNFKPVHRGRASFRPIPGIARCTLCTPAHSAFSQYPMR